MPLGVNSLKLAETVRSVYQITATAETKPEDLVKPEYWTHVARKLRMGDRIEVMAADATWYAELRVMEVGRKESFGARLAFTLPPVQLSNEHLLPALNDYEARPFGSSWQVYKSGSADPVKTDLPNQSSAIKWIESQRKALAA